MKSTSRDRRRARTRQRLAGTPERPRVSVFRSARFMDIQIIDDAAGRTLLALSSKDVKGATKVEQAQAAGQEIAGRAQKLGITQVVFDRRGYAYHGRVKAVAEGLRAGGLTV
jgi:large subunit ribosomal protein L18